MLLRLLRLRGARSNELALAPEGTGAGLLGAVASGVVGLVKVTATLAGGCYGVLVALAFTFQRKIIYFPNKLPIPRVSQLPAKYRDIIEFCVHPSPGVEVCGWYWPPPPEARSTTLLYFHGNAGSRHNRLEIMNFLRRACGVGVCMIDYRGYSDSTGRPSEAGLVADGRAALHWLQANQPKGHHIVLHLESIGSGVGAPLVSEAVKGKLPKPSGVIVEGGFSSIVDVAESAMPFLMPRLLMLDRYNNVGHLKQVRAQDGIKFLFLHGEEDTIVPIQFARRLYDALPKGDFKEFVAWPEANHNELPLLPGYTTAINRFLDRHGL